VPELDFSQPMREACDYLWLETKKRHSPLKAPFLKQLHIVTDDVILQQGRRRQKGQVETFSVGLAHELLRGVGCNDRHQSITLNMQGDQQNRFQTYIVVENTKYSLVAKHDIIIWRDDPVDQLTTIEATGSVAVCRFVTIAFP